MRIVTRYLTNANGRQQILAKGGGKQRTITYDHALTPERNHGNAAGTLAKALGLSANEEWTHIPHDKGQHLFTY